MVKFDKGMHTLLEESFDAGKQRAKDMDKPEFKEALRYIYRRLESDIKCQPRPHMNFYIQTIRDGTVLNEEVILDAFFKKRMDEFNDMHPNWTDRGRS